MTMPTKYSIWILVGMVFFIVDRILKYLFFNFHLQDSLFFSYIGNPGMAFGIPILDRFISLFYTLIAILLIYLVYSLIQSWRNKVYIDLIAYWLIILGATSNIIDRIKFNFVIDYISLYSFPVFNIGDSIIVIGVFMLLYSYLKEINK